MFDAHLLLRVVEKSLENVNTIRKFLSDWFFNLMLRMLRGITSAWFLINTGNGSNESGLSRM